MSDNLGMFGDDAVAGMLWVGAVSRMGEPLVQGGVLSGDFLQLVPGFFSDNVTDSIATLQRFVRLLVHGEPSQEDFHFFLGYHAVVPPYVREGLLTRNVDNDDVVERTRKPVLLVHGEGDQILLPRMCTHLHTLMPQAAVAIYPNVGHMPFWKRRSGSTASFAISAIACDYDARRARRPAAAVRVSSGRAESSKGAPGQPPVHLESPAFNR